jgi:thioredoxin-related protein
MKTIKPSLLILVAVLFIVACNSPQSKTNQTSENQRSVSINSEDVLVYYFHNTKRCATCNAVEEETKMALTMFYEERLKAGSIEFTSLNLEEDEGKAMAQTLKISGQTLLIVQGETQVNLTNEGFMNARTNPSKFHEIVKEQIDQLL